MALFQRAGVEQNASFKTPRIMRWQRALTVTPAPKQQAKEERVNGPVIAIWKRPSFRYFRSAFRLLVAMATCAATIAYADDATKPSSDFKIPEPYIESPKCPDDLKASLSKQYSVEYRVLECFRLIKWGLDGIGIAAIPHQFDGLDVDAEGFAKFRKAVFQQQTEFLRTTRDKSDWLPGEEPAHATIPRDLFVKKITGIGVFMNEPNHIGVATLIPFNMVSSQAKEDDYPVIRTDTLVLVRGQVYTLLQIAQLKGPQTFRHAYNQADDWARRMNGGRRLATED